MIFYTEKPGRNFVMVDKNVLRNQELSNGAKVLYCQLAGLKWGHNEYETKLHERLGLSQSTYHRLKKELVKAGLVQVIQTGPRDYEMHVGNSKVSPEEVKARRDLKIKGAH